LIILIQGGFVSCLTNKRRPNSPPYSVPALRRTSRVGKDKSTERKQRIAVVITFRKSNKYSLERRAGPDLSSRLKSTLYFPDVEISYIYTNCIIRVYVYLCLMRRYPIFHLALRNYISWLDYSCIHNFSLTCVQFEFLLYRVAQKSLDNGGNVWIELTEYLRWLNVWNVTKCRPSAWTLSKSLRNAFTWYVINTIIS